MKLYRILMLFFVCCTISCSTEPDSKISESWWKESVFYEIYMPSYKDSDGDGYSDFNGLISKLDYIQELGIKGIWLTPFLESPMVDNGYDVSDYRAINKTYGNLEDFKQFVQEAHKRDIKVIMDMVVNHTSTHHQWFQESRKSKESPYRDYYIWRDQPNNWESFFGGTAWEYDEETEQFYYHQFDVQMADLNWQNPKVIEEVQDVLRFWLELGVDGFRLDVINFLTTDGITTDNPTTKDGNQKHENDIDQGGVKDAMRMIKNTVNEYENRFIVGEIGSDKIEVLKQYQSNDLLDVVFNFNFGSIAEFSAERIYGELQSMEQHMDNYPTLFFGSHDMPRLLSRLAENNLERAESLAALMLTAKGIPFIYYGEEIGMENIQANSLAEIKDIQGLTNYQLAIDEGKLQEEALQIGNEKNRDKSRSPMQWNPSNFAGFSTNKSWIKVHENYKEVNVKSLESNSNSILNKYKNLIALRNSERVLQYGKYTDLSFSHGVISYTRVFEDAYIKCVFNFSETDMDVTVNQDEKILVGKTTLSPESFIIVKGQVLSHP